MRITTHFACQTLDWFPLVSTLAQVVHAIAYPLFKKDLNSSYGRYLNEYTLTAKFLIAIPGINVLYKLTALFFTKKSPQKLSRAPSSQKDTNPKSTHQTPKAAAIVNLPLSQKDINPEPPNEAPKTSARLVLPSSQNNIKPKKQGNPPKGFILSTPQQQRMI